VNWPGALSSAADEPASTLISTDGDRAVDALSSRVATAILVRLAATALLAASRELAAAQHPEYLVDLRSILAHRP
jgi:hypothetical protein